MTTQLAVFNETLRLLERTVLTTTTEETEDGRQLRGAWDAAVKACFEEGNWKFALAQANLGRASETPTFGWSYAYQKPTGWVRTVFLSETGLVDEPLREYDDIAGKIVANVETVYMTYVSSAFFTRIGDWSQKFADFVAADLATRVAVILASPGEGKLKMLEEKRVYRMKDALSFDAMQGPPGRLDRGRWVNAGRGWRGSFEHGRRRY